MIFRDHAPFLAEMGYFVFPLRGKSEHLLPNGCNGASNDLKTVERWADQHPDANIGIKCENVLVLDLDVKDEKNGLQDLLDIAVELGPLPGGPKSETGSGGVHLFFKRPAVDIVGQTGVKWKGRKTGIDIRIGNQYVVAPISIHPNGNPYKWVRPIVPVEDLPDIPQSWIDGFLPIRGKRHDQAKPVRYRAEPDLLKRIIPYMAKMEPAVQGSNGHNALLVVASFLVHGCDLSPDNAFSIAAEYYNPRCVPPWDLGNRTDYKDFRRKFDEAISHPPDKPRGWFINQDRPTWSEFHKRQGRPSEPDTNNETETEPEKNESFSVPIGEIDPVSGKIVLDINVTLPTAEAFIRVHYTKDGVRTLHYQNEIFYSWQDNAYRPIEHARLRGEMLLFLHDAVVQRFRGRKVVMDQFPAKKMAVDDAVDALKGATFLPSTITPPHWLGDGPMPVTDPSMVLFGKTKNLDISTMRTFPATPLWFNYSALEFDYEENPDRTKARCPTWDKLMSQIFEKDAESMTTLMMYMGLLLTPITKFQKALFIVGPKRSGKGTIARVIRKLVGPLNCCSPTTDSLASPFGLQTLIGKNVAIVSDARFSGPNTVVLVERILNVTGEDELSISRKHIADLTARLPTRFLFLSNEIPRLADASGALASRFIVLKLTKSFFDEEDLDLENKLLEELPGILDQAITMLRALLDQGRFIQPESARDEVELLEDLASPIGRFVKERCNVGPGLWTSLDDLWNAWKAWCEEEDIIAVGTKPIFFRNLGAAVPSIVKRHCRVPGGDRLRKYEGIALSGKNDF